VRRFTGDPLPEEDLEAILRASQRAPTGWNLQPVTMIVVREKSLLQQLSDIAGGQEHVASADVFIVYTVDYAKVARAAEEEGLPVKPGLANLYEALIDAGIMAGWGLLAAESLGYGGVLVALYENPCPVVELLDMPKYTIPAVGLALGRPAENPAPRPRQRLEALAPRGSYGSVEEKAKALIEAYNGKARRLFTYVFSPDGYYATASERLRFCLEKQGLL
jgi:nitroreductase